MRVRGRCRRRRARAPRRRTRRGSRRTGRTGAGPQLLGHRNDRPALGAEPRPGGIPVADVWKRHDRATPTVQCAPQVMGIDRFESSSDRSRRHDREPERIEPVPRVRSESVSGRRAHERVARRSAEHLRLVARDDRSRPGRKLEREQAREPEQLPADGLGQAPCEPGSRSVEMESKRLLPGLLRVPRDHVRSCRADCAMRSSLATCDVRTITASPDTPAASQSAHA